MSAKPYRRPYVQPASNDPGVGQGRAPGSKQATPADFVLIVIVLLGLWALVAAIGMAVRDWLA